MSEINCQQCKLCNYSTNKQPFWIKHISSVKHVNNIDCYIKNHSIDKDQYDKLCKEKHNSDEHIFYSYGSVKGKYHFPNDDILTYMCTNDDILKKYAFVEHKTEYYILMFDFDFKNNEFIDKPTDNEFINTPAHIVDFIIMNINKVLKDVFVNPNIQYIYCDKNDNKHSNGVHIYYPNIVVNKFVHYEICKKVYGFLINNKTLPTIKNINDKQWSAIFDMCVAKANGLRLPYCYVNGSFYKQNKLKSTYNIPEYDKQPNVDVLKLCCVRTNKTDNHPKSLINFYVNCPKKMPVIIDQLEYIDNKGNKYFLTFKTLHKINKISLNELDKLLQCIDVNKFLKYDTWFTLKFIVFNCNSSLEACKIFHKYGCVGHYANVSYDEIESHFIKTLAEPSFDSTVLRCYARKDNVQLFNSLKLNTPYEIQLFDAISINCSKLTKMKNDINDSFMENEINTFLNNDIHILCICSAYGTGKTTLIKESIKKYTDKMNRCLFITHRRTLATDIEKNFTDIGFISYLDKDNFNSSDDKIIVNMDSLRCLYLYKNYFTSQILLQQYDVIILDEFASLLNNFESSLMGEGRIEIHNIFKKLILDTPKVICCDGDFSNREYQYLMHITNNKSQNNKILIYHNIYKPNSYNFTFTKNEVIFLDDIEADLKKKRNIVITSISSNKAQEFEKYYKNKGYKVLCIIGNSDMEKKKLLVNPNQIFNNVNGYQLFIYSPCITVGVNIDFPYFYKQYGFICSGAICARDYMQMLFRVRQFENNNMTFLMPLTMSTTNYANFYQFEEVVKILCIELQKNPSDLIDFDKLRIWNYWEEINSKHYFLQTMIHFINKKGYTYVIENDNIDKYYYNDLLAKKNRMGITNGEFKKKIIEGIVNAPIITPEIYKELIIKQKNDNLSDVDKFAIEKYYYINKFNLQHNNITYDTINKIYNNDHIVNNYDSLIGEFNKNDSNSTNNTNDLSDIDLSDNIHSKRLVMVNNIISSLGFKLSDFTVKIAKEDFNKNKITLVDNIVKQNNEFNLLFNLKNNNDEFYSRLSKGSDNKKFLGFVNSILHNFGIKIKCVEKVIKDSDSYKKIYPYSLSHTDVIEIYLNK